MIPIPCVMEGRKARTAYFGSFFGEKKLQPWERRIYS